MGNWKCQSRHAIQHVPRVRCRPRLKGQQLLRGTVCQFYVGFWGLGDLGMRADRIRIIELKVEHEIIGRHHAEKLQDAINWNTLSPDFSAMLRLVMPIPLPH